MAFKLFSDIRETTETEGTGDYVLEGAVTGFWAFGASGRLANGDTTFVEVRAGDERELFLGTYNSGANSITRTGIYKSTNSNAAVNWGAGPKDIFCTNIGPSDLDAAGLSLLQGAMGISGFIGYSNLTINVTGSTTVDINVDRVVLENSVGTTRMASAVDLTATITNVGANGRDYATTLSDNTWHSVWVIFNPTTNTVAALLSTSATSPSYPSGYTYGRRVGWVRYEGGLASTIQRNAKAHWKVEPEELDIGEGGDSFPTSYDVSSKVPSTAVGISFLLYNEATLAPNDQLFWIRLQSGISAGSGFHLTMPLESTTIYIGTGSTSTFYVIGWEDAL